MLIVCFFFAGAAVCGLKLFGESGVKQKKTLGRFPHRHTSIISWSDGIADTSRQLAISFRGSLETLARNPPLKTETYAHFRRILVREHVGLDWDSVPEKYWEDRILPRLRHRVNIVDIGANVGQFAVPNAQLGHNVISFEPNKNTCLSLISRIKNKDLENLVSVHCVAAGEKRGIMKFVKDVRESTSFVALSDDKVSSTSTVEIPVERVDDMISPTLPYFLFKTDTQGFELGVLKGAKETLAKGSVFFLMVEFSYGLLNQAGTDPIDLLNFIYDLGYVCTYMAYHTRMHSEHDVPIYSVVQYQPYREDGTNSLSFVDFVNSLRVVSSSGSAGVSGWTDLLCVKP